MLFFNYIWINQKWPFCFVLYCWFCYIFMMHGGCLGDSWYSSFKRCLLEMLVSGKMKPGLYCSQFQTWLCSAVSFLNYNDTLVSRGDNNKDGLNLFCHASSKLSFWCLYLHMFVLQAFCQSSSRSYQFISIIWLFDTSTLSRCYTHNFISKLLQKEYYNKHYKSEFISLSLPSLKGCMLFLVF